MWGRSTIIPSTNLSLTDDCSSHQIPRYLLATGSLVPQMRQIRKYLFIAANESPSWGGSERLWTCAAESLARRGNHVRVSVSGLHRTDPQLERLRSAGCQICYRPGFPPFFYRMRRRLSTL